VRTLDFHQRIVLLHFEARFVLTLLAQQVGHDRFVVRYAHAKRYGDGLAPAMVAGRVIADRSVLDLLPRRVGERNRTQTYQQQRRCCRERRHRKKRSARHRVGCDGSDLRGIHRETLTTVGRWAPVDVNRLTASISPDSRAAVVTDCWRCDSVGRKTTTTAAAVSQSAGGERRDGGKRDGARDTRDG